MGGLFGSCAYPLRARLCDLVSTFCGTLCRAFAYTVVQPFVEPFAELLQRVVYTIMRPCVDWSVDLLRKCYRVVRVVVGPEMSGLFGFRCVRDIATLCGIVL